MKILVIGAGVIGATYAWQLSLAGEEVTLFVRSGKKDRIAAQGIPIHCTDERAKQKVPSETIYQPSAVDDLAPSDRYELIIVCVKSNQLESILPLLHERAGKADILFFQNNWWGDDRIRSQLPSAQYLFGFSRLVGGWREGDTVECVIFNGPGQATMLGEKNGAMTTRLQKIRDAMARAGMKPQVSGDILGWLACHYVEYLGPVGAILKAGSARSFASSSELVKESILATREGLAICRARGIHVDQAAPANLKNFSWPLAVIVPLGRLQYGLDSIQRFFEENIAHGMDEITSQYGEVVAEGQRLGVKMPVLEGFAPYFLKYQIQQGGS